MYGETDKTIPPGRRQADQMPDFEQEKTMPGHRDQRAEGRFAVGDLIAGQYKVLAELGRGGMGVVYKCFDEISGIEVALKALPPELSGDPGEMEDIRDNFRLVSRLVHQNIAVAKNLAKDAASGNYYLIMEYCEGEDLRRWIRRKRRENVLTLQTVLPVISQIADALDYAHKQKIMHRDIKPGNIMIAPDGAVKVLDFGLAAQIHTSMTRVSMNYRGTSGTGPYMSPEQWRGHSQGAAADQYALAVMTYELLAGHLPFESTDPAILKQAVLDETPEAIPDVSPCVQEAIAKAMSKNAADRYESCKTFILALSGSGKTASVPQGDSPEICFRKGKELYEKKDYTEAVKWYRKAAEQGHAKAQNNLGNCYYHGNGVEENEKEAVKWYRKAAEQGDASAQYDLGNCYYYGRGVGQNYEEAVKWYRKAAEQGYDNAQHNLGNLYYNGEGVKQNYEEAVKWFRKAAELGYTSLGVCYQFGRGVDKDINEAVKWYRKAAEQGSDVAQCMLNSIKTAKHIKVGLTITILTVLILWLLFSCD